MTAVGPPSQRPHSSPEDVPATGSEQAPTPSPAVERAKRLSFTNMLRSLLPLVVIVLVLVGWAAWRQNGVDPVRQIDPSSTVRLAASGAGYPVLAPTGLPAGYRPTSARTDAGTAGNGKPVTLEIGYVTPSQEYAGFVESDDDRAGPLVSVLQGARQEGTVELAGQTWTRSRTTRGETALSREVGDVTLVVTGSAGDRELQTVASSVRPYSG